MWIHLSATVEGEAVNMHQYCGVFFFLNLANKYSWCKTELKNLKFWRIAIMCIPNCILYVVFMQNPVWLNSKDLEMLYNLGFIRYMSWPREM